MGERGRNVVGLLLALLVFANCSRKSKGEVASPSQDVNQNDTVELPPGPPGPQFVFSSQKQNLEAGNIGIVFKESEPNVLYVNICGGNNVHGVTFDLDYDSTKLRVKGVTEGDFLKKDGVSTKLMFADPQIVVSRIGQVTGASGDGTICVIELEAEKTFDSLPIGFKGQTATDKTTNEILPADNWFGGVLAYK